MKDVQEVLTRKEMELAALRKEIESLQLTIALLTEEQTDSGIEEKKLPQRETEHSESQATGTHGLFSSVARTESGFWRFGKRKR
jgi:prefoldin subunit 5